MAIYPGMTKRDNEIIYTLRENEGVSGVDIGRNISGNEKKLSEAVGKPSSEITPNDYTNQDPYAKDNIFCKDCEKLFGEYESKFSEKIYEPYKNKKDTNPISLDATTKSIAQKFIISIIWRVGLNVLDDNKIRIPQADMESMRKFLLDPLDPAHESLKIPQIAAYFENKDSEETFVLMTNNCFVINQFIFIYYLETDNSKILDWVNVAQFEHKALDTSIKKLHNEGNFSALDKIFIINKDDTDKLQHDTCEQMVQKVRAESQKKIRALINQYQVTTTQLNKVNEKFEELLKNKQNINSAMLVNLYKTAIIDILFPEQK